MALLSTLLSYANEGFKCYPGYAEISKTSGLSRRTVERWIPKLEKHGFFTRQFTYAGKRIKRTHYDLSAFVFGHAARSRKSKVRIDTDTVSAPINRCKEIVDRGTDSQTAPIPTQSRNGTDTKAGKGPNKETIEGRADGLDDGAWRLWVEHRQKLRPMPTKESLEIDMKNLVKFGPGQARICFVARMRNSIKIPDPENEGA